MNRLKYFLFLLVAAFTMFGNTACERVEPGEVGVRVDLGSSDSASMEVLDAGLWWSWIGSDVYVFPISEKRYPFSANSQEGNAVDESVVFNSREGVVIRSGYSVAIRIHREQIIPMFMYYRADIDQIMHGQVRDLLRSGMMRFTTKMSVDTIYTKQNELLDSVRTFMNKTLMLHGIEVVSISNIGQLIVPPAVLASMEARVKASQDAITRQNELQSTQAAAQKAIVQARSDSTTRVINAAAESMENHLRQQTLTPMLLQRLWIEKWDGKLPTVQSGNNTPMMFQMPAGASGN